MLFNRTFNEVAERVSRRHGAGCQRDLTEPPNEMGDPRATGIYRDQATHQERISGSLASVNPYRLGEAQTSAMIKFAVFRSRNRFRDLNLFKKDNDSFVFLFCCFLDPQKENHLCLLS